MSHQFISECRTNLTLVLLGCIQQQCGYNATSQLQESRPATVKVVYTILYSPEASLQLYYNRSYSQLTFTNSFQYILLSGLKGSTGSTQPWAERQRRSPHGSMVHQRGLNPQPYDRRTNRRHTTPIPAYIILIQYYNTTNKLYVIQSIKF